MNQHKFKAWHIEDKRWIEYFLIHPAGKEIIELDKIDVSYSIAHEVGKDVELVAWTGVKDVNNKEIYTDHILKEKCEKQGVLVFEDGSFWLDPGEALIDYTIYEGVAVDLEIIGHKLENPELL